MVDQAQGEVVAVEQADPHSNNIHVAHNNPRDSDIMITQTNPFNTTIHISLNVGTGCKVSISAVVGLYRINLGRPGLATIKHCLMISLNHLVGEFNSPQRICLFMWWQVVVVLVARSLIKMLLC